MTENESKKLVVNADDYGITPRVSEGIRFALNHGIVTSTTALMNIPGVSHDLMKFTQECPKAGLGIHLNLTLGSPLLDPNEVPSLVDHNNKFHGLGEFFQNPDAFDISNVYDEWHAQINRMLNMGINPDHLDSHHHISYRTEPLFDVMLRLANEFGLPLRTSPKKNNFKNIEDERLFPVKNIVTDFYGKNATKDKLIQILSGLKYGITELMVHPGFIDPQLTSLSGYIEGRQLELDILTDPQILSAIENNGIQIITFPKEP